MKKKLYKYISSDHSSHLLGGFFLAMGVVGFIADIIEEGVDEMIGLFTLMALSGGVIFFFAMKKSREEKSALNELISGEDGSTLISDFQNGTRYFKDSLILGEKFIIGKGSTAVFRYTDIRRAYQTIESNGFFEEKRDITVILGSGKICHVGKIPTRGRGNEDVHRIFEIIEEKNPNAAFGFNAK